MQRVSYWDIVEDSGLQIITLWGPTIGNSENINLEILDLPSPKGSKTRVHGGGVAYIYIYTYFTTSSIHVDVHPFLFKQSIECENSCYFYPETEPAEEEIERCIAEERTKNGRSHQTQVLGGLIWLCLFLMVPLLGLV